MNCDEEKGCYPILNYPKIGISEYGRVLGDLNIQKEIYSRGPVACYINYQCLKHYQVITFYNLICFYIYAIYCGVN